MHIGREKATGRDVWCSAHGGESQCISMNGECVCVCL